MSEDAPKKKRVRYTEKTLKELRTHGYTAQVVERWQSYFGGKREHGGPTGVRVDLFGFIDVIAMKPGKGILGVQSTSEQQRRKHYNKMIAHPNARTWILSGGHIVLSTWKKVPVIKQDGTKGKSEVWVSRMDEIHLGDLV